MLIIDIDVHLQLHEFLRALSYLDPETHQLKFAKAAPGSMNWISENQAFINWRDLPGNGILRVSGPPGSGTTVVASHLLRLLLDREGAHKAVVMSFAFNKQHLQARTPTSLFLSLSRQLLSNRPSLFRHATKFCAALADLKLFTQETIWTLLCSLLRSSFGTPVFCIIHSTQECETSLEDVIGRLEDLIKLSNGSLKIIVTGEDSHDCDNASQTCHDICLADEETKTSIIKQFVQASAERLVKDKPVWKGLEKTVEEKLCTMPTTYLLAMRRMDLLRAPDVRSTKAAITQRVKNLPCTLEESYDRALKQIQGDQDIWVQSALRWIVHAVRPLKQSELAVAVALEELNDAASLTSLKDNVSSDIIKDLNQAIGSLIKVVDDQVYPIHRSFRNLLARRDKEKPLSPTSHSAILSRCLDYLELVGHSRLDRGQIESPEAEFSLLDYATVYWPVHFKQTNSEPAAVDRVSEFLGNEANIQAWSKLYLQHRETEFLGHETLDTSFQIACRFGFLEFVEALVTQVKSAEDAMEKLRNALNLAARYGHEDIVEVLIREGAVSESALGLAVQGGFLVAMTELLRVDPHVERLDSNGYMPLHQSAARGYKECASLLLERKANPDARTSDGSTALHLAAMTGQLAIVGMLVDKKADVTILNGSGYDALKLAAQSGFSDIVEFLVDNGADVNASALDGNTALHLAVEFRHPITSRILLKTHKDVNCLNGSGLTPFHLAAREGDLVILQQLLNAGARAKPATTDSIEDAGEQSSPAEFALEDDNTPSPLQLAAQGGHIDVVQELLKYKADYHPRDGSAALYYAAAGGYGRVVKELLDHGINEVAKDPDGDTALHVATERGHLDVLAHLLEWPQFKVNATNDIEWTPLHKAAKLGNVEIAKNLIASGAQILRETDNGETPLHIAAGEGHLLVVKELQRALDTSHTRDREGRTAFSLAVERGHTAVVEELLQAYEKYTSESDETYPFHSAVREGHKDIVQLFLDSKWDLNSRNNNQETPLHVAAYSSLLIVELLLKAGANVDAIDEDGETPLSFAARMGSAEIVKALLNAGANIEAKDNNGETPLYRASYNGRVGVVKELLASSPAPDLNVKNYRGWTALHSAYDNAEITKLLLDAGANAHVTDEENTTPLVLAVRRGYDETFCHLLNAVADSDAVGEILSAVHSAAGSGRLEMLQLLVEKGANLHAENEDGTTALHIAASNGRESVVNLLLKNGADIHKESKEYGTPLMAAAQNSNVNVAKLLLEKGADVNGVGGRYHTALQAASLMGNQGMVELLLEHNANPNLAGGEFGNALFAAISDCDRETVTLLLDAGADPNAREDGNDTPLQMAAWQGLGGIVELLLKKGAKVNDTGNKHGSALNAAIEGGDLDSVEVLLKYGANPNLQVSGKDAPVQIAARKGLLGILTALVAKGADLTVKDQDNRSILTHAILWNSDNVIEYLLEREDTDFNEKDAAEYSPLIVAVRQGSEFVKALLEKKADPDSQDSEGKTPLIHAVILDYQSVVETLLENKANPTVLDARGRGPLYWACRQGSVETFDTVAKALKDRNCYTAHCELAIHAAVAANRPDFILKLLKNEHTHPNKAGIDGWTPIYTARRYGLGSIESQLVAAGAVENRKSKLSLNGPSQWHLRDKVPCLLLEPDARCVTVGSK